MFVAFTFPMPTALRSPESRCPMLVKMPSKETEAVVAALRENPMPNPHQNRDASCTQRSRSKNRKYLLPQNLAECTS